MVEERGTASCLDAKTGDVFWSEKLKGNFNASPIYAAGNIYFTSVKGETYILKPGEMYTPLAINKIDGRVKATPAFVSGRIVLKTDSHLYMIEPNKK
jgi:outer membrane protein assembly factor BamB